MIYLIIASSFALLLAVVVSFWLERKEKKAQKKLS